LRGRRSEADRRTARPAAARGRGRRRHRRAHRSPRAAGGPRVDRSRARRARSAVHDRAAGDGDAAARRGDGAGPPRPARAARARRAPPGAGGAAGGDGAAARIEPERPAGWTAQPTSQPVTLAKLGDETTVSFDVSPAPGAAAGAARPVARVGDTAWSLREDVIDHPHIPMQVVLRPATVQPVPLSIKRPSGRIAYVKGSGDSIASALAHIGLAVDELDDDALRTGDLSRYTAVVLGIRAYNTRPAVHAAHARLMAYAERGGTVIVQYNT